MKKWILLAVVVAIYGALSYGAYRHFSHAKAVTPTPAAQQAQHDKVVADKAKAEQKAIDAKKTDDIIVDYNKLHGECLKGASATTAYNALTTVKVKAPVPVCGTELLQ